MKYRKKKEEKERKNEREKIGEEKNKRKMERACGAMETRLTTDQKIPGSTPGRLVYFFI